MSYRIALTGSHGLVGTSVLRYFQAEGHHVTPVVRAQSPKKEHEHAVVWDIPDAIVDEKGLEGHDVVIHLAGATIARKWTADYKREIFSSRVDATKLLCDTLSRLQRKPMLLLSASAVGYYGMQPPEEVVDERTPLGKDFLAQVCHHWETATGAAEAVGIRVCHLRFGVVLSKRGGALAKMLPVFKAGLGGPLGSGRQMMSWIAAPEIPLIMRHLIEHDEIRGPVNCVAPQAVSNAAFTKQLGRFLHRPAVLPAPGFVIKALLGEMGETLLLNGQQVAPRVLKESRYVFKYPTIDVALPAALNDDQ